MTAIFRFLACCPTSLALIFLVLCSSFGQTVTRTADDISFQSQGHSLKGKFYQGDTTGRALTLILLQGFPGNQQDVLGLGQKLAIAGVNVFTFNYSGTHKSEGEFTMSNTLTDIQAAYDYLHQSDVVRRFHVDTSRVILGGYSYGGGMALTYASRHPEIRRVVSIAGTDHGEFAREYLRNPQMAQSMDSLFDKLKTPDGPINFEGRGLLKKLAANPTPVDLRLSANDLAPRDILLIGGWDDAQITIDQFLLPLYRSLKKAGANKIRFVALHADHSFRNVREELATELLRWMQSK
jgi:dienelactone hydrolase